MIFASLPALSYIHVFKCLLQWYLPSTEGAYVVYSVSPVKIYVDVAVDCSVVDKR